MTRSIDEALAERVITLLNELVEIDRDAIEKLVNYRVACNRKLGEHPTVQVGIEDDVHRVGLVGILNGVVGVDDYLNGAVAVEYGKDGKLVRFVRYRL